MNIKQLRKKVLELAISGQLVPQDPNDVPIVIASEAWQSIEETPFKVPENWVWAKLGDLPLVMGQSPDSNSVTNSSEGLEFHQGKIFFTDKVLAKSRRTTTKPSKISPANSVLLCVRAPVGKINITDREICIGRGLCSISSTNYLDLGFLWYLLLTYEDYFNSRSTGSTFKAITKHTVETTPIPLPPLAEQQRIVAKVDEIFAVLDSLSLSQAAIGRKRDLLMKKLLTHLITNNPAPKVKLGEVTTAIGDGLHGTPLYDESGEYYFINGNNLNSTTRRVEFSSATKRVNHSEFLRNNKNLNTSTVLLSINGTLGNIAYYNNEKIVLGKSAAYISVSKGLDKEYLSYFLQCDETMKHFFNVATGSTIKNLGLKQIRETEIPLPPLPEQHQIISQIEAIQSELNKLGVG